MLLHIFVLYQKDCHLVLRDGDRVFRNCAFHNVLYNIFKIKPYIFKILYTIINKYINNYYFKRNNNIFSIKYY